MSEKIFQLLLKLYPRRFKDEYAQAMQQLFRDRLAEGTGLLRRVQLWTDVFLDLAISVPREHWRRSESKPVLAGEYRMSDAAVAEMMRSSNHFPDFPLSFLAIFAGLLLGWLGDAPMWPLCTIYGLVTLLFLAQFHGTGKFKDYWRSYQLILLEDRIEGIARGRAPVTLLKVQITNIVETPGFGLAIQTQDPSKSIWVPSVLTGYEQLRAGLAAWTPIQTRTVTGQRSNLHGTIPWALIIYPAALLVSSAYYAVPLATLLVALIGACFVNLRKKMAGAPARVSVAVTFVCASLILALLVKMALVTLPRA